jgi:predicted nucleic acid-binding protein
VLLVRRGHHLAAARRLNAEGVVTFDRDFAGIDGIQVIPQP